MNLTHDVTDKLKRLNIFEKIIVVNALVFVLAFLLNLISQKGSSLLWFELPSDFMDFIVKPWSLITYAFIHYDFWHVLFNMLWLYFIGRMFINLFNVKLGLNVYFLGAIFGGLLYMLCYNLFPSVFNAGTRLVGASAAVRALLIFLCAYMPATEIRFFTFNLKLWYVGVAIVILDVLGLYSGILDPIHGNSGGYLAHLGGAILGYFYAVQLKKGKDIGKGFERLLDAFFNLFKKSKTSPLKTVHKKKASDIAGYSKKEFSELSKQKRIDVILDKISKSGYESLTKDEKEFLFKAGK